MFENLERLKRSNRNVISKSFDNIKEYCKDPEIYDFVELITDFEDIGIANELRSLVYQLGFTIHDNNISDCFSVVELASFFGNINDDFYFITKQNERGLFIAKGDENGHQDIQELITAAKKNYEYYQVKDTKRLAYLREMESKLKVLGLG